MTIGIIKSVVGLIGACLALLFGGWDAWLQALVTLVVLDYVSGLLAAYVTKSMSSQIGFKGIAKKVFIFILVGLAVIVDNVSGNTNIRNIIIGFYAANEALSIIENAGIMGIPLPPQLKTALTQVQNGGMK